MGKEKKKARLACYIACGSVVRSSRTTHIYIIILGYLSPVPFPSFLPSSLRLLLLILMAFLFLSSSEERRNSLVARNGWCGFGAVFRSVWFFPLAVSRYVVGCLLAFFLILPVSAFFHACFLACRGSQSRSVRRGEDGQIDTVRRRPPPLPPAISWVSAMNRSHAID